MPSRRSVLRSLTLSTLGLAGCLGWTDYEAGDLVVENERAEPATVSVSVQYYRDEPNRRDGQPAPGEDPDWQRSDDFDVGSDETVHERGYVQDEGTYYVSASDGPGNTASSWAEYVSAADDGLAGSHLRVTLHEDERVTLSTVSG